MGAFAVGVLTLLRVNGQSLPIPPGEVSRNLAFVTLGLEPEWVTAAGYARQLGKSGKKLDFYAGAGVKLPVLIVVHGAWRANLLAAADWRVTSNWDSRFSLSLYNAHDHNRAAVMNGLGFELRAAPAHRGRKWTRGLDLGWQCTALTHLAHSAETRATFDQRYPAGSSSATGPQDGWYGATGSRFRLGFASARQLGAHWRLQWGVGGLAAVQKQGLLLAFSHAQVPFYLESTVHYRW